MIKIITGVQSPSAGTMKVLGEEVTFRRPIDATAAGIGVVHQERNLIPDFSVGENILLDRVASASFKPIHYDALYREAESYPSPARSEYRSAAPGVAAQRGDHADGGNRPRPILAVAGFADGRTNRFAHAARGEGLFKILRNLRDQGVAIVFVSHKLDEVLDLCDTVTVLRDGAQCQRE